MRKTVILIPLLLILYGFGSKQIITEDQTLLKMTEFQGIKAYEKNDFEQAFNKFSYTGQRGFKDSQYGLAFMFLKGQYVDQSLIIGMGWLGVASETNIEEWKSLFDQLYSKATIEQKIKIDEKVAQYISKFGIETQSVKCRERSRVGSRKRSLDCHKSEGITTLYDIERN